MAAPGTCTIAIAMTSAFQPGELPGNRRTKTSPTDTATWQRVYDTAEFVYQQCVENEGMAGWEITGKRCDGGSRCLYLPILNRLEAVYGHRRVILVYRFGDGSEA